MKKAVIITPFDNYSYQVRIKYVEQYLSERGYNVKILSSDFDHRNKTVYLAKRDNLELLHVPTYKKNLSYARINSHRVFAKNVLKRLEELNPDLIYCSGPPNFLFKYTSQYKKKNTGVKLIYELGDLWPETLPLQTKIKKIAAPALNIWAGIRNKNIGFADGIIYECEMFSDVVSKYHPGVHSEVIYLSKEDYYKGNFELGNVSVSSLRFAYVGSINNIIDIEIIVEIMKQVSQKREAELVVIGGGESADRLFTLCDHAGVKYENHGITYDEEEKHRILSSCQFGLNIMKNNVAVGATMKSLEYFHEGLVLINNIPADTERIVERYNCGFNLLDMNMTEAITRITSLSKENMNDTRMKSRKAYEDLFETDTIKKQFLLFLSRI